MIKLAYFMVKITYKNREMEEVQIEIPKDAISVSVNGFQMYGMGMGRLTLTHQKDVTVKPVANNAITINADE